MLKGKNNNKKNTKGRGKKIQGRRRKGTAKNSQGGRNHVTLREIGIEDSVIQTYKATLQMTAAAIGGVTAQVTYYNATSMFAILNGGAQAAIPYWNQGLQENYRRYLVLQSRIRVKFISRELVQPISVVVTATDLATAFTSPGPDFADLVGLPQSATNDLSPYVGGQCNKTLHCTFTGTKMFGKQFLQQDEYSAPCGSTALADPTTMMFWAVAAFFPTGTPTAVTGGYYTEITVWNKVKLFGLERDTNTALFKRDPNNPDNLLKINGLKVPKEKKLVRSSSLK